MLIPRIVFSCLILLAKISTPKRKRYGDSSYKNGAASAFTNAPVPPIDFEVQAHKILNCKSKLRLRL